ncbi:HAD-IA family hydrolase [Candidatus Woesearchaeota archaeon]|nr:HAD-IA family hydrolase [Candidatus Woesearchaeota archaeon]
MIKAVMFDIDNTIIDFLEMKKKSLGPAVDAMIDKGLKMSKEDALAKIYDLYKRYGMEYKLIFQEFLKSVGQSDYKILAAGIIGYRSKREVKPYQGMLEVLDGLKKRGLKLAIVSDAPNLKAWMRLTYMGIEDMFDVVVAFDDTNQAKPAKLPFEKAVAELGVKRQEVLMIGDMPEKDIAGARQMGFVSCFAKYGNKEVESGKSGADYEAKSPEDILLIVDRINNPG